MVRLSEGQVRKGFRYGTDRTVPPERTLDRIRPLLPAMGITRLANVTGLDVVGLPVVMACRPNSRSLSVAQGKGLTLDAAMASAAMETIESYHAENVTLPLLWRSRDELAATGPVVGVARLASTIPGAFHPGRRLLWVESSELFSDRATWVPFGAVHLDFTYDVRVASPVFRVSSTGLASGNHRLEAVSHALGEVVERDAMARWYDLDGSGRDATRLGPDTIDDEACRRLAERITDAGLRILLHDLTSAFGVAVIRCELVEDPRRAIPSICSAGGYGCHPDRNIALLRAVTEAAQSRLTLIAGSRDDMFRTDYQAARDRDVLASRWEAAAGSGGLDFATVPTHRHESFDDDVALLLDRLRRGGVAEVAVVDLSQPRFGLPVVRAVVPGLRTAVSHGTRS